MLRSISALARARRISAVRLAPLSVSATFHDADDLMASAVLYKAHDGVIPRITLAAPRGMIEVGDVTENDDIVVLVWSRSRASRAESKTVSIRTGPEQLADIVLTQHRAADTPAGLEHAQSVYILRIRVLGGELAFSVPPIGAIVSIDTVSRWMAPEQAEPTEDHGDIHARRPAAGARG